MASGSLSLRPAWSTEIIPVLSGLHRENLFWGKEKGGICWHQGTGWWIVDQEWKKKSRAGRKLETLCQGLWSKLPLFPSPWEMLWTPLFLEEGWWLSPCSPQCTRHWAGQTLSPAHTLGIKRWLPGETTLWSCGQVTAKALLGTKGFVHVISPPWSVF